jgi:tRNA pseudouridine38-40 synthase
MRRYLIGIQYNGSRYSGWSDQIPNKKTKPGIVYTLHQALEQLIQKKYLNLIGSSRTDAGVHAIRNYFHLDILTDQCKSILTSEKIVRGLNTHLREEEIQILSCQEVPSDFDSRRNATSRTYMYRVMTTEDNRKLSKQWLFQDQNVWYVKHLDVKAMNEAAQHLIGIHDYTTFRNRDCQSRSTFRHLWRLEVETFDGKNNPFLIQDPFLIVSPFFGFLFASFAHLFSQGPHQLVTITITGNAFLYRMVRNIVGTLVAVGHGEISPDEIPKLLEAKDRLLLPPLAPPKGLFLMNVTYNEEDMSMAITESNDSG